MSHPEVTSVRATLADYRRLGYCARGGRRLAISLGLDWAVFASKGLPVEELEATRNDFAMRLAAAARERARVS